MPRRLPRQLALPRTQGWGGARPGAGRKRSPDSGVSHRTRPDHRARHPVHVTLRALPAVEPLHEAPVLDAVVGALAAASRTDFRVVHYSVQSNHVHLIVEAHERAALIRGLHGLAIRVARAVNKASGRRGRVWADRYHARRLATPRETRNALVYVLHNWKKSVPGAEGPDPASSAPWFDGWRERRRPAWLVPRAGDPCPVRAARTWLLVRGWRRHGLLSLREGPRVSAGPRAAA